MLSKQKIGEIEFGHNDAFKDKKLLSCFMDNGVITQITKENKNFIFGRKGSGKSAISNFIHMEKKPNAFTSMLSFYDFPMELLYRFSDRDFRAPSQYITLWKYIIYLELGKMILKDESIDNCDAIEKIKQIMKLNFDSIDIDYNEIVNKTKDIGFKLILPEQFLGVGLEFYKSESKDGLVRIPYNKIVSILEECLKEIVGLTNNKYILLFDELDRKYDLSKEYNDLLLSLFDVVNEINYFDLYVSPYRGIVFLRTDIYSSLKATDLNKISDEKITLNWFIEDSDADSDLRKLINKRISDSILELKDSVDPWLSCFEMGQVEGKTTFEYILDRTYYRPRDLMQFCKECTKIAKDNKVITLDDIQKAEKEYSKWLKDELIDEIQVVLPEINYVFDILREIGNQVFSYTQFANTLKEYRELKNLDPYNVLKILFEFNIIGDYNSRYGNKRIFFLYRSHDESIKFKCKETDSFLVFRGLNKALKLKPL